MSNNINDLNLENLKNKINNYKSVLDNTKKYRQEWNDHLKDFIKSSLSEICKESGIKYEILEEEQYTNLGAIILTLGNVKSGIYQIGDDSIEKHLVRHNGSLIYQQLFNGKIMVVMNFPVIESYMEPKPPKTIAIYRPEELKAPYILRHVETLISEIIAWEDYDDEEQDRKMTIGFQTPYRLDGSDEIEVEG